MLKILFYHANIGSPIPNHQSSLFLSIAAVYLKTYLEINYPEVGAQVTWALPLQHQLTDDELVDICKKENPDLLCTGHYIWNQSFLHEQLTRIRSRLDPKCKFVLAGPSIDVNLNPNFFTERPYADYAIYGAGELAFAELIKHLVQKKSLVSFNVSNLAWYDKTREKQIVSEFKYVPQSSVSPFLFNESFFTKMVQNEINNNVRVILPYELTRGCPYACTFCDWNSGLSNKVTRRKKSFYDEIDLFQKLGIKDFYMADANFGQYDEDIEIVEYMAQKNIKENAQFKTDSNLSKLRKDNNLKIYHALAKGDLISKGWGFTFSVQDINDEVLKNIDRPDVGWDVHERMINELRESYPEIQSKIQFIVGLPGQTVQTIQESLSKITRLRNVRLSTFLNELLPASPASLNLDYQKKFKFSYSQSERVGLRGFFRGKFPASCISFDQEEFIEMILIASMYTGLADLREEMDYSNLNIDLIVKNFINSKYFSLLKDNLYNNWTLHDKFYYTMNFDGTEEIIPACDMGLSASAWIQTKEFRKFLLLCMPKNPEFVNKLINKVSLDHLYPGRQNDRINRISSQESTTTTH